MKVLLNTLLIVITVLACITAGQQYSTLRNERALAQASKPSPVDVGFAQFMGLHHQQAVTMAQFVLDDGDSRLEKLARGIIGAQLLEMGEMRGWLNIWGEPLAPGTTSMGWMLLGDRPPSPELAQYLVDCESSPTGMPGLATNEQLMRLRALDGDARDRFFLELMLAHHQGGIPMAQFAADHAKIEAVRRIASSIVLDQAKELNLIRSMLSVLDQEESQQPLS